MGYHFDELGYDGEEQRLLRRKYPMGTRTARPVSRRKLKDVLTQLRTMRLEKDALEKAIPTTQELAVELLQGLDVGDKGFKWTDSDPDGKVMAHVQQAEAPTVWNTEDLVAYLHENGLWAECSTRVLDLKKVEALIANDATSPVAKKSLLGFTYKGKQPKPFISFRKEK